MKNILQILPALNSGGVERGTVDIAKYLANNGYGSFVVSSGGQMELQIAHSGSKHIKLPVNSKNPLQVLSNIKLIEKVIKDYNIDIVHARSRAPAWSAYFAAKNCKKKFITTFHGTYKISNSMKRYYNSIMTKGDKIIAVSDFVKNHIIDNYQVDESKITVIHRGLDIDYFSPLNVQPNRVVSLAEKYNLDMDKPIILLPARITKWKGHLLLLEALREVAKDRYYCIISGDSSMHPSYLHSILDKIREYDLGSNVVVIDNVIDMPALYYICDIVISPSLEPEAFGRVIIEGQAMGKIVLASNIGGAKETIIENQTGFLFESGNKTDLADKIRYLLNLEEQKRKIISLSARDHIANNFTLNDMCKKTVEVYKSL